MTTVAPARRAERTDPGSDSRRPGADAWQLLVLLTQCWPAGMARPGGGPPGGQAGAASQPQCRLPWNTWERLSGDPATGEIPPGPKLPPLSPHQGL